MFTHDGEIIEQEHYNSDFNAIYSSQIYRNKGCRFCHDQFANEADISFFDFWNVLEVKNEKIWQKWYNSENRNRRKIAREVRRGKKNLY